MGLPRTVCPICGSVQVGAAAGSPCLVCPGELEGYRRPSPEDIDFPVSWAWHRHYEVLAGRRDPGPDRARAPQPTQGYQDDPDLPANEAAWLESRFDQLEAKAAWLQAKLLEQVKPARLSPPTGGKVKTGVRID